MGRPAINTVFNPAADKDLFNGTPPSRQATAAGGKFRNNVINSLKFFSSLDSEGRYSDAQAAALAGVLIPDVLVYSRTSTLPAPLNGRALADDVIDVELNVTTGGDPLGLFPNRDATGAVPGDGVGPHTDYLAQLPVPREARTRSGPRSEGGRVRSPSDHPHERDVPRCIRQQHAIRYAGPRTLGPRGARDPGRRRVVRAPALRVGAGSTGVP